MTTALVMIKAKRGCISQTAEDLLEIKGVTEVYSITGDYDLVAMVRVRNPEEVADVVTDHLQSVAGIEESYTHVAFRVYSRHDLESAFSLGQ